MGKKITSVKVEKKQLMKENFKKKGLPELLSEVNFFIDTNKTGSTDIIKKFISAVKRKFKPDFFSLEIKERMDYFHKIKINDVYTVEILPFERSENEALYDYMYRLLFQCQPKSQRTSKKEIYPVKVRLTSGEEIKEGYSILDGELGSTYHRTTRAFTSNKKFGYNLILDISSLIAESIVIQSLSEFALKNKGLVQYLFVKNNLPGHSRLPLSKPRIPTSDEFKDDYLSVAQKYGFDMTGAQEAPLVEDRKSAFYVENLEIGHGKYSITNSFLFSLIVEEFIRQSNYVQYKTEEEVNERSDYAKAFQTKKSIKNSHMEKMEKNAFLKRYGFVELDNDVDLKKFNIIEENFNELMEQFHIPYRRDYSFRIKKLGKHRAAGVFFPYYKTTIFDLNHPDAYVHELGHQIDCILAQNLVDDYYSETFEFRRIYDEYKTHVNKLVNDLDDSHSFKTRWNGKTKYNKQYYFKPTEVFARTFEIYMTEKGVVNSLLKTKEELLKEHVYPFDEKFVKNVVSFFEQLEEELERRFPIKQQMVKKKEIVASPVSLEEKMDNQEFEQLSLFDI